MKTTASGFVLLITLLGAAKSPLGIDFEGMDRRVKPGADFFAYANGTWLKKTEIPSDQASFGTGAIVRERTEARAVELIKNAATTSAPTGSELRKVGDYYLSYMDEAAIEAAGLKPDRKSVV